ncbi:nicotinate phosphoribosyltransferase isoform X1 [Dermatophagoides farinae]|uniref:Nicotinate phosphoribosyltransferase n=2 Tax=Dermatophagoides farinae TaxID=6954 RepID=A0A9D4NSI9_DERFA|nr:nicotinate phosphoribosyltransferase-like [Dermatophagoides farinae]KAH7637443.1 nicotinate phosphoribosyltransferase-like protein [Dermatophagoides farinae]
MSTKPTEMYSDRGCHSSIQSSNDHVNCCRQIHMPLLTDKYQITMAYAYWKNGMSEKFAVFDIFFRKNPFGGEFTVFAGLEECLNFLQGFHYTSDDIDFFRKILFDDVEDEFFDYLSKITAKDVVLYSVAEGSVVFPKEPLMRIEGPLVVCQLLETTFLTLVNYACLIATNAARYKIAIDNRKIQLLEFGLRRAQGPDGGLSASKYSYIGGFDGTSNLLAGRLYNIPVKGTHAHSFIMSHSTMEEPKNIYLKSKITGEKVNFVETCLNFKDEVAKILQVSTTESSKSELIAFISYALAFPDSFLALVDTYDVIRSGILNFCIVTLALDKLGYRAIGIRVDSGDLAYQSIVAHRCFQKIAEHYQLKWFNELSIIVSNDINEETIISLNEQKHKINAFGIGTHLVTCQKQPALGCVYKLVEIDHIPCIKISLDLAKVTIPCRKNVYRIYGREGYALLDLLTGTNEEEPKILEKILCRHPFEESKRCFATPSRVERLLKVWWIDGKISQSLPTLIEIREHVQNSLAILRPDIKRLLNPTPYKVSVTDNLYQYMHQLWLENAPVGELH